MKKKLLIIGCSICGVVIVFLFGMYWLYQREIKQNVMELEHIVQEVTIITEEEKETEVTGEEIPCVEPICDFEALKELNQDVYAWIRIPETQVDYPVLQSETDNKYLNTNIDGSSGYPGCIYSNVCNSKEFDDYITVLYGHNMKSGEMFGSLHLFGEADFFQSFETFTVETEKEHFRYSVYAAVNYNDKLIPAHYDVKSVAGRDAFLESLEACKGNSNTHFNEDIEISENDKVLVLSVCMTGQKERRFLIISKMEEKYPIGFENK